jgi:hypothetical protein
MRALPLYVKRLRCYFSYAYTYSYLLTESSFQGCGDIKGICVRFQKEHGIVILAFFDIRHAQRAKNFLTSQSSLNNASLNVRDIPLVELRKVRAPFSLDCYVLRIHRAESDSYSYGSINANSFWVSLDS